MARKPKISVVLVPEVREVFASELGLHLRDGCYLNCDSVEHHGDFLDLEITVLDHREKPFSSKISIPKRFVLYTLSAPSGKRALGFQDDD
jgi:hypothetical protein